MISLLVIFFFSMAAVALYFALRPRSKRLAWVAAGALGVLGIALSIALTLNILEPHPGIDVDLVDHEWVEAVPVEFGSRLRVRFHNYSSARLHSISGTVTNTTCKTDACAEPFEVRIPIPAGKSYTQSWTSRINSVSGDQWQLDIQRVQAYTAE